MASERKTRVNGKTWLASITMVINIFGRQAYYITGMKSYLNNSRAYCENTPHAVKCRVSLHSSVARGHGPLRSVNFCFCGPKLL